MSKTEKFYLPSRYEHYENKGSVWSEYAQLSADYKPIDLGHGFPNFLPPQYVKDALKQVAESTDNSLYQYTRGYGHPRLVHALSKLYSHRTGREIKPFTEIMTTSGGYHAIFCSIMGVVDVGDEVIIIEPFFDCYGHNVKSAGGVPKYVPLKLSEDGLKFVLDRQQLKNLFNEKTKVIIINTPHNPTGKVFTYDELNYIADLCKKWNVLCIADEVYEFLVYDSNKHIKIATLPDMWERTLTIGSAGKLFGVTGFKLGWVCGPEYLIKNLQLVHHNCVRAGNTMLQEMAAICVEKELSRLGQDDCYFISLRKELEEKRNFMYKMLKEVGMKPILSEGGYFLVADWSSLENCVNLETEDDKYKDYRFTKWMTKNVGIQGIPLTPFYDKNDKHLGEYFVRYCFVKTDECLDKTAQVLKEWKPQSK